MREQGLVALLVLALLAAEAGAAGEAGEVVFTRGVATAQGRDGQVRLLGRGAPLAEGDTVTTARRSFAVLRLADGTRMTVRPDSVLRLQEYQAEEQRGSALLRLFKGGLRAVTGWISKRNPNAFRIRTSLATIGIRGTDFEARVCAADCAEEAARSRGLEREPAGRVAARVVFLRGQVRASRGPGSSRALSLGGSLYAGDQVETIGRSIAVLAFPDRTRVTLQPRTRFRIEEHRYQPEAPAQGSLFLRLLRGGLRAVTGLIGRSNRNGFRLATPVATVGIRGTGFDIQCQGECVSPEPQGAASGAPATAVLDRLVPAAQAQAGDGMFLAVWDGAVVLKMAFGDVVIEQNRAVFVPNGATRPIPVPAIPLRLEGPRPDRPESTDPGMEEPFAAVELKQPEEGLFVTVFEGDVVVEDEAGGRVHLGELEVGYVGARTRQAVRVRIPPRLVATPSPALFDDPAIRNLFRLFNAPGEAPQGEFQCTLQ